MTYDEFIVNCKNRILEPETYTEKHHIIPRCIGGSGDVNNLIILTAQEHYIAHKLLALENPDVGKLQQAWWMMSHCKKKDRVYEISEEDYAESKLRHIKEVVRTHKGVHLSEETKNKIAQGNKGKERSLEIRKQWSESHKGQKPSDETRKKMSESQKGIRKGGKSTQAKKVRCIELDIIFDSITEAEDYVNGYNQAIVQCCKGRRQTHKGYHWEYVNN